MEKIDWEELEKKLKKALTEKRYRHTLGVAYTASALAMRYGCDLNKTRLAGLLHDCAKCMSNGEMKKKIRHGRISVTNFEMDHPALLHAKLGVRIAQDDYGIDDPEMNLMEKIIFTSDYIEPNRDRAPNLPEIRAMAFQDLDRCVGKILSDTVAYLSDNPKSMDQMTLRAMKYYLDMKVQERG